MQKVEKYQCPFKKLKNLKKEKNRIQTFPIEWWCKEFKTDESFYKFVYICYFGKAVRTIWDEYTVSFRYSWPDDSQSAGVTHPPVYVIRRRGEAVLWRGRQRDPWPGAPSGHRSGKQPLCIRVCSAPSQETVWIKI